MLAFQRGFPLFFHFFHFCNFSLFSLFSLFFLFFLFFLLRSFFLFFPRPHCSPTVFLCPSTAVYS